MKIKDNYTGGNILWFNDFYFENGNILFSVGNFNGLYKYAVKEISIKISFFLLH